MILTCMMIHPLEGDYHTPHLLKMHEVIFQDLYEWAGSIRTIIQKFRKKDRSIHRSIKKREMLKSMINTICSGQ